jgi:hypothetical protein
MEKQTFWSILDTALSEQPGDAAERREIVIDQLCELSAHDILGFDRLFNEKSTAACTWDLFMAAHLMNGNRLDIVEFEGFRAWLISRGESVYKAALEDPETLVEFCGKANPDGLCVAPAWSQCAAEAYQETEGHAMPEGLPNPIEPLGEEWDETDDALKARLPKLYAKCRG